MRLLPLGILALLGTAGMTALLAQTVDGVDVQAVKKRSADLAAEAQAFVDQVKDRGDRFREDAATTRDAGTENMRRVAAQSLPKGPTGPVDFDEIVQGAAKNTNGKGGEAPQFIAFASLSMPDEALKQLVRDTASAGGVVVFRGFPNNSAKEFVARLSKVVDKGQLASIGIDPRLFRAFQVQAVPTYVSVSSDFDLCAGFSCTTKVPPYDRMIGNVTVEYALTTFSEGNGPGARVAAVALSNMKRTNP
ncbi:type-F conjugative transfer system pilin assembly protein TrbC [Sphingomonas morindae]|uniref:Type-F conjugative transfer system pilin assembly protein TrbC n=1 Tax=Sphingomonas morindae TaxID=1541170 RepID=A0ABY4XDQ4_9SPHN|nr:type-F conjugative transfer system pilin assembly protein TrbC [Sphingomonas morindae]USI75106.1 type-F conjugative transfer system pilin assembly protein TrbC [Sphingomonas morindae]